MTIAFIALGVASIIVIGFVAYRVIELRAQLKFERWKGEHTQSISREAIKGSQSAVAGRVFERVAPYLPGFGYNPKDARFIGDPVDFVIFDGLSEGNVRRIVFLEVKSGTADLNGNERKVKAALLERRVEWSLYRAPNEQPADVGLPAPIVEGEATPRASGTASLRDRGRF